MAFKMHYLVEKTHYFTYLNPKLNFPVAITKAKSYK